MSRIACCPSGHQWAVPVRDGSTADVGSTCPQCGQKSKTPPLPAGSTVDSTFLSGGRLDAVTPPPPEGDSVLSPGVGKWSVPGYEILGELGRGGMGVVYKARQAGLNRLVALKMILAGPHAGQEHLARFATEARAVARLQHPNIVQVYEVGEHDGRPYLTLEFIAGGSLAGQLAASPPTLEKAADLVETLARAIQAAHDQGIVHRDLKPGNVLLTADGVPKVSDFGLAKLTVADDTADGGSGITRSGVVLGTPSYMAPEQAAGHTGAIGPAADVYALGAILYDLLTGRPPFRGSTVVETLEQVRSHDPVPPRRLQPHLPRALETVCLKCLQKEPRKRYASAHDLAEDLRRFRAGEPILARPVGWAERLALWSRRHPGVATLAACLAAVVVGSLIGLTLLWRHAVDEAGRAEKEAQRAEKEARHAEKETQRAEQEARNAENETRRAEKEARNAVRESHRAEKEARNAVKESHRAEASAAKARQAVNDYFVQVSDDTLLNEPGMQPLRRKLLEAALRYYREFLAGAGDDPALQAEVAKTYWRIGRIAAAIGPKSDAELAFHKAAGMQERLLQEGRGGGDVRLDLALTDNSLGNLLSDVGKSQEAWETLQKGRDILEPLSASDPSNVEIAAALAGAYNDLGLLKEIAGRTGPANDDYNRARRLQEKIVNDPARKPDERHVSALAAIYTNLADLYFRTDRPKDAIPLYEESRKLEERLTADHPRVSRYSSALAATCSNLGMLQREAGRRGAARSLFQRARDLQEKLARDNPGVSEYERDLGVTWTNLGRLYLQDGQRGEAVKALEKARDLLEKLVRSDSTAALCVALGRAYVNLGITQAADGKKEEGLRNLQKAIPLLKVLANEAGRGDDVSTGETLFLLGGGLMNLGKAAEALPAFEQAVVHQKAALAQRPDGVRRRKELSRSYFHLAHVQREVGKPADASATALTRRDLWPDNPDELYDVACELARCMPVVGKGKDRLSDEEKSQQKRYTEQALATLRLAVARGLKDVANAQKDNDLAPLRTTEEFQRIVKEAEKR